MEIFEHAVTEAAQEAKQNQKHWRVWGSAAGVALLIVLGVYWMNRQRTSGPTRWVPEPLTAYPGRESFPSFSPDGNLVAFCWNGEKQDNWDVYIKQIGMDSLRRLTSHPDTDFSPVFSPDGQYIAFLGGRVFRKPLYFGSPSMAVGSKR